MIVLIVHADQGRARVLQRSSDRVSAATRLELGGWDRLGDGL